MGASNNILMLWPVADDYQPRIIKEEGVVDIASTYPKMSVAKNILRKICVSRGIFLNYFLNDWKKDVDQFETVIVQAAQVTAYIPEWLRRKGYMGRIIYWYWDPVSGSVHPDKVDRAACELWSFDPEDCKKYFMRFCDTYYPVDLADLQSDIKEPEYDVCFIGRDKGRLQLLRKTEEWLRTASLKPYFYIVPTKPYDWSARKLQPAIDYKQTLDIVKNSKAILDLTQEGQSGLSMRCMESIFMDKKLITNNANIVNYEFYDKSRVYLLGSNENIQDFMEKSCKPLKYDLNKYSFQCWLNRMGI